MKNINRTIIVVGVHTGLHFMEDVLSDEHLTVFGFEPNPNLVSKIKELPSNYKVIQKAVSDVEGKFPFWINSDTYSSSLRYWGTDNYRWGDMEKIDVEVVRLDRFIIENNIKSIENLFIDAQGSDLEVLKGLGEFISIVDSGVCESMAPNTDWSLYEGQSSFEDIVKFLTENGFKYEWEYNIGNGIGNNEVNIKFKRYNS